MKKIDTFYIVVTILIIIMMSLPIYFDCKTNSLFLLIPACIMLLLFCMWFRHFSKEIELNTPPYSEIKTFEDAVKSLGMDVDDANAIVNTLKKTSKATAAMYKLNIVRKALNYGQDLHFTKKPEDSCLYYPYNAFITESSTFYGDDINSGRKEIIGKFKSEGTLYDVLGGNAIAGIKYGLGDFFPYFGIGDSYDNIGFLGCANEEIAKHFGKHFGLLITEAKYGDLLDFEIIEDKYGNA